MSSAAIRPVAIKIDDDTRARLKSLAGVRNRSPHWLMREAITQYVEREERRDALRMDTLQAWEDHRATGLHATADEVDAWLATWGTDEERPAPACHN